MTGSELVGVFCVLLNDITYERFSYITLTSSFQYTPLALTYVFRSYKTIISFGLCNASQILRVYAKENQ
jgi:hypothetical protein